MKVGKGPWVSFFDLGDEVGDVLVGLEETKVDKGLALWRLTFVYEEQA